jgi:hypothetical protein
MCASWHFTASMALIINKFSCLDYFILHSTEMRFILVVVILNCTVHETFKYGLFLSYFILYSITINETSVTYPTLHCRYIRDGTWNLFLSTVYVYSLLSEIYDFHGDNYKDRLSSGMLHRVDSWIMADVSEEFNAPFPITMTMTVGSRETSVNMYHTTMCNIPDNSQPHILLLITLFRTAD